MADTSVTLELDGDIPLPVFASEMHHWSALIAELSSEINRGVRIEWFVDDLMPGSAKATARGESEDEETVSEVVREYMVIAHDLQSHRRIGYSMKLRRHARALVSVVKVKPKVRAIRFLTAEDDVTIGSEDRNDQPRPALLRAYGAIEGRVQTLSSRRGLAFTLYDSQFDKAVSCYLRDGQESLIEDKWNHPAVVEGIVSRDPITGRPVAIRHITGVTRLPDSIEGDYRDARGIFKMLPDDERPEVTLRRLRDAW